MKNLHSAVMVKDLSGKVIKKLDVATSNVSIRDAYTVTSNRIEDYMHRYVRSYTLG